jgi:glycosyltransferase involved in cell wall biosynthesis
MAGYRFLFWYSNKKSRAIITISNFVKKDLAAHYPFTKNKTTTTYCASEPPFKQIATPKIKPKNFIMYVGTPFPHKNLENLIKAFGLLRNNQPELELVLIGKKEHYYTQLEKQYGSTPGLHFTGFVSDEELRWYYENTRGYVFPSLSEGFGLPGLEAMVHGCPVVSSNATCLPEIYGEAAHYFNPEDTADIANKIDDVLSNRTLRESLIKKGHEQVKKYSWQKMTEQTVAIYKKSMGQK